jgi:hypothetical protein
VRSSPFPPPHLLYNCRDKRPKASNLDHQTSSSLSILIHYVPPPTSLWLHHHFCLPLSSPSLLLHTESKTTNPPHAPKGGKRHLLAATFLPLYTLAAGPDQPNNRSLRLPSSSLPRDLRILISVSEARAARSAAYPRAPFLLEPNARGPLPINPPGCCCGDLILSRPAGRIGPAVVGLIRGGVAVVLWLAGWWEER